MNDKQSDADNAANQPDDQASNTSVYQYLLYGLSIPERTLRGTSAVVGGAIRESTILLLPQAFRSSQSYRALVEQMLDFMVQDVGGVELGADQEKDEQMEAFVARKTVGSFIEMAGIAALHVSPMLVLAVVSDVAYGSSAYLDELGNELKNQGVIEPDSTIDNATDLLEAVSAAAGTAAEAFDTPPLSVDGVRKTIEETRSAVAKVDPTELMPQKELDRIWTEMHTAADEANVSVMDVSAAMSMVTLRRIGDVGRGVLSGAVVAGNMFDRHIFDHYEAALTDISEKGFYVTVSEASRPYIDAVWQNFSSDKETVTEELVSGRLIGKAWRGIRSWLGGDEEGETGSDGAGETGSDGAGETGSDGAGETGSKGDGE